MKEHTYTRNKLVLIGIDGATFDIMDPLLESGRLPHLGRIIGDGCRATLNSLIIPTSPMSWSSIVTGKNPGKHGIFHFTEKVSGQYNIQFVNASVRQGPALWELLSRHGKRVIVVNVPITYPPDPVSGSMVSGFDAPDEKSDYTYPPELSEQIRQWIGPYTIDLRLRSSVTRGKRFQVLRDGRSMEEKKTVVTRNLMESDDWDFLMIVFNITDRIQHWFWQYMDDTHPNYSKVEAEVFGDAISSSYEIVDEQIGRILEMTPDDARVMVISDHGFGPATNRAFYLNHWLAEQGFLRYLHEAKAFGQIFKRLGHEARAQIVKRLPRQWKGLLKRHFPKLKGELASYLSFSGIDWSRTKAFSSEVDNFIYINLKGREPQGIVEPEDYEKCLGEISAALSELADPETGDKLIERVYTRDELYHGSFVEKAPDLIFSFAESACRVRPSQEMTEPNGASVKLHRADNWASGNHRMDGVFAFSGPGVENGGTVLPMQSILDIAPSVLYAMGLPVPEDMDGRAITEAFGSDFQQNEQICFEKPKEVDARQDVRTYEDDEAIKIQQRLKDLGYLD